MVRSEAGSRAGSAYSGQSSNSNVSSSAWSANFGRGAGRIAASKRVLYYAAHFAFKSQSRTFFNRVFLLTQLSQILLLSFALSQTISVWPGYLGTLQVFINRLTLQPYIFDGHVSPVGVTAVTVTAVQAVLSALLITVPIAVILAGRLTCNDQEPGRIIRTTARHVMPTLYLLALPTLAAIIARCPVWHYKESGLTASTMASVALAVPVLVAAMACQMFYVSCVIHTDLCHVTYASCMHNRVGAYGTLATFISIAAHMIFSLLYPHPTFSAMAIIVPAAVMCVYSIITQQYYRITANIVSTVTYSIIVTTAAVNYAYSATNSPFVFLGFIATPLPIVFILTFRMIARFRITRFCSQIYDYELATSTTATISPAPALNPPRSIAAIAAFSLRYPAGLIAVEADRSRRTRLHEPVQLPGYGGTDQFDSHHELGGDMRRELRIRTLFRAYQYYLSMFPKSNELLMSYIVAIQNYRPININDGIKRADELLRKTKMWPDRSYFYFSVFKSKMDLLSGDPDQAERAERSRRLHTINKSQRTLKEYRARFWETIVGARGRALSLKTVGELLKLAELESNELHDIQNAYRPLLAKATPNVIRDYAVFCRSVLGMEDRYKTYLSTAEDLETSGRQGGQVTGVTLRDGAGFGLWGSAMEFQASVVFIVLALLTGGLIGVVYLMFNMVFVQLMWLFFCTAAVNLGYQNEVTGVFELMITGGDPRVLVASTMMTTQLYSALANTAPVDYIQSGLAHYKPGMELSVMHGIDTGVEITEWAALHHGMSNANANSWETDLASQPTLVQMVIDLVSNHLNTLDTGIVTLTYDSTEHTMSVSKAIETVLATAMGIAEDSLAGVAAAANATGISGVDLTDASMSQRMATIAASSLAVEAGVQRVFMDVFHAAQNFPLFVTVLCGIQVIAYLVFLVAVSLLAYAQPISKNFGRQLEILRIFFLLPDEIVQEISGDDVGASKLGKTKEMLSLVPNHPSHLNSVFVPETEESHTSPASPRSEDTTGSATNGDYGSQTGSDPHSTPPAVGVDDVSEVDELRSVTGDSEGDFSSSSDGMPAPGMFAGLHTAQTLPHSRSASGAMSDDDLVDAETLNSFNSRATRPKTSGTDEPAQLMLEAPAGRLKRRLASDNVPAVRRWSRIRRGLVRNHVTRRLPVMLLWNAVLIFTLAASLSLIAYRIVADVRTCATGYIAYQGALAANGAALQAVKITVVEAETHSRAVADRAALQAHVDELGDVLGWLTSSSISADEPWMPSSTNVLSTAINVVRDLILPPSWTSGPNNAEIQALLYSRACVIGGFVPEACTAEFGGTAPVIATELDAGMLEALSYYISQATSFLTIEPEAVGQAEAADTLFKANNRHIIGYQLMLQYLVRDRFTQSTVLTGYLTAALGVVLIVVLGAMYLFLFRRTAGSVQKQRSQLIAILDLTIRRYRRRLAGGEVAGLIDAARPGCFDDDE